LARLANIVHAADIDTGLDTDPAGLSVGLDARRLFTATDPPRPRPAPPTQPAHEHRRARRTLIVLLALIGVAFTLAHAPSR